MQTKQKRGAKELFSRGWFSNTALDELRNEIGKELFSRLIGNPKMCHSEPKAKNL